MVQEGLRHILAVTSRRRRLPAMYSASSTPRAFERERIISGVRRPLRMRSALTALARIAVGAVVERVLPHEKERRGLGRP